MDPKGNKTQAITDLQSSIDKLNDLMGEAGADIDGISGRIDELLAKQTAIQAAALKALLDDPANQAAIDALNDASKKLTHAAGEIKEVTTALKKAAAVVSAAASFITALGPFAA